MLSNLQQRSVLHNLLNFLYHFYYNVQIQIFGVAGLLKQN